MRLGLQHLVRWVFVLVPQRLLGVEDTWETWYLVRSFRVRGGGFMFF